MVKKKDMSIIIALAVLGILLIAAVPLLAAINGGLDPEFVPVEKESVPENAVVIKLTEEDYEKYPIFRDIPQSFYIDDSLISGFYIRPGCVDRETGNAIWETYAASNTYVEHNGIIYKIAVRPVCT